MAQIRHDPGRRLEGPEEVVVLLMYLRFPDPQERTCPPDIDTIVRVVSTDELNECPNDESE